jgi:MFS transporter, CP family, cyanate transporter
VLLAAALRVAVASFAPILSFVTADVEISSAVVGLIGAAPPVAFAVFGILTPMLARRFRLEALAVVAALVSAAGLVARAFAGDAVALVATTLLTFAGVGVGNVLMPALIKKYFPSAIALMTTVYISSLSLATLVPPVLAVPIAEAAGWRVSLGVWAAVGALAALPWLVLLVRERRARGRDAIEEASPAVLGRLLRLPVTWALVGGMLVTSATVYSMFAWLPSLVQERAGVDAATAGGMLGVFGGMGLPFALVVPIVAERFGAIRSIVWAAVLPGLVGVAGMLWAPASAPWLWVLLMSLPTAFFPLVLVLFGLRTRDHATTVALSGVAQSIGYAAGALFPIVMGALHEASHGWESSLWVLAALFVLALPIGLVAARPGTVEETWERRHGPW